MSFEFVNKTPTEGDLETVLGKEYRYSETSGWELVPVPIEGEWVANTVNQAEAEAGTSTTRRAWTAQRVRQAILGWWSGSAEKTKLDGIQAGAQVNVATNLSQGTRTTTTVPVTSSTGANATLQAATASTAGVMTSADKAKLDGISPRAQINEGTNLGQGGSGNTRVITSSTGSNVAISTATTSNAGFMSTGDKTKLDGVQAGAQVNTVTSVAGKTGAVSVTKGDVGLSNVDNVKQAPITRTITAGAGLSGGGNLTADRTFNVSYGTAAGTAAQGNDSRLSNSREWTAGTISQAEAEAGTVTTRRAFTAQRVRQAIVAWWNASVMKTKLDGIATGATKNATDAQLRDRSTHTGTQAVSTVSGLQTALDAKAASSHTHSWSQVTSKPSSFTPSSHTHSSSQITDLGTAATKNVGISSGNVMEVGAFGLGVLGEKPPSDASDLASVNGSRIFDATDGGSIGYAHGHSAVFLNQARSTAQGWAIQADRDDLSFVGIFGGSLGDWNRVVHSNNLLQTTGTSTRFPMSQKATTDALNTKVDTTSLGTSATKNVATTAQAKAGTAGVVPDAAGVHAALSDLGLGADGHRQYSSESSIPVGSRVVVGSLGSEMDGDLGTSPALIRLAQTPNGERRSYIAVGAGNPQTGKPSSISYMSINETGSTGWRELRHDGNTTSDTNGFLRSSGTKTTLTTDGGVITGTASSNSATTGALQCRGGIGVSGSIWAAGNVTAYSDTRLKKDVEVIPNAIDKVKEIRGVTYTRIDSGERQVGVIAQEVQKVLPEAVSGDDILGVSYGNMVGLLVEAIKEQQKQIDELRKEQL